MLPFLIHFQKAVLGHEDLTTNLEFLWKTRSAQPEGYRTDGLHIGRDLVALLPIASGHCAFKLPVSIVDADGCSIVFQLADKGGKIADALFSSVKKVGELLLGISVPQGKHGSFVLNGGKVLGDLPTHPPARRERIVKLRILRFQIGEAAQQLIEFPIGDGRGIQLVVAVVVGFQLFPKLLYPNPGLVCCHLFFSAKRNLSFPERSKTISEEKPSSENILQTSSAQGGCISKAIFPPF